MIYNRYNQKIIKKVTRVFQGMEYVMAVYQEQSFSKAADKLFISQPSLSANIKRIEKRLGFDIFDRSTIPLKVTEFGEEYIRNAKEIKRIERDFSLYLNNYSNLQFGRIALGGTSLFAAMILPRLMARFSQEYPGIQLELFEATTNKLINMLHDGEIDLLLDNAHLEEGSYESKAFAEEYLLLAVPESFNVNHRLAQHQVKVEDIKAGEERLAQIQPVSLSNFKDYPFVLLKEDNDTGMRARILCQEQNFEPDVLFNVEQQMTSFNVSQSGMAISFIGDTLLASAPDTHKLCYYRIAGEQAKREIRFYWRKDRYQSKAAQAFIDLIDRDLA